MISIAEAIDHGLKQARHCPEHRANQEKAAAVLLSALHQAGAVTWGDLRPGTLRRVVQSFESQGYSPNTIRAYTNPLRLASNYMVEEFDVNAVSLSKIIPKRSAPVKRFLNPEQLKVALGRAGESGSRLARLGMACALTGMRLTEAMRLDVSKLDSRGCLLTISGRTKNDGSARVIPVLPTAMDLLLESVDVPLSRVCGLSRAVKKVVLDTGADLGVDGFDQIEPREACRKTFANLCFAAGVDMDMVKAYMGHAFTGEWDGSRPGNVLMRHYVAATPRPEDMEHVRDAALNGLRERVVKPLHDFCEAHAFFC